MMDTIKYLGSKAWENKDTIISIGKAAAEFAPMLLAAENPEQFVIKVDYLTRLEDSKRSLRLLQM